MNDDFGDRMKGYESKFTETRISPEQFMVVRLDGKNFSKFTKGFAKPFDDRLHSAMVETTKELVNETHADMGYTQSDEITLLYSIIGKQTEYMFGGKVSKINSVLASMATVYFNKALNHTKSAFFDCRAFEVPSAIESTNALLWRVQDAKRNSVSSLFRWTAGHSAMKGLGQGAMKEHLISHFCVDWDALDDRWKYGTYVKRTPRDVMAGGNSRVPVLARRTVVDEIDIGYFGKYSIEERLDIVFGVDINLE